MNEPELITGFHATAELQLIRAGQTEPEPETVTETGEDE